MKWKNTQVEFGGRPVEMPKNAGFMTHIEVPVPSEEELESIREELKKSPNQPLDAED